MIILIISAAMAINIWYLISFRLLMVKLEEKNNSYWKNIDMPNSFSAPHVTAIICNLYKSEMTRECHESNEEGLLRNVRILLPTSFIITGSMLLFLFFLINP